MNERCKTCKFSIYANSEEPSSCDLDEMTDGGLINPCRLRRTEELVREEEMYAFHKEILEVENEL